MPLDSAVTLDCPCLLWCTSRLPLDNANLGIDTAKILKSPQDDCAIWQCSHWVQLLTLLCSASCNVLPGGVARPYHRLCYLLHAICCCHDDVDGDDACCRCVQIRWWAATLCAASQEGNASVSPLVRAVRYFSSVAMHSMISCCCGGSKAARIGIVQVTHADQWLIVLKERHGKLVTEGTYRYQACSLCHCSVSAVGVRGALACVLVHAIASATPTWNPVSSSTHFGVGKPSCASSTLHMAWVLCIGRF